MKNISKILGFILLVIVCFCTLGAEAKPKQTKVYVFGVSMNLTDSITYITDIQVIEPAYIETKTGFLYDRSIYSQQLQLWLEYNKNQPATTCTIFFSEKKEKIEKKFNKIRTKFLKAQDTILKPLGEEEFKFIPQDWTEHESI